VTDQTARGALGREVGALRLLNSMKNKQLNLNISSAALYRQGFQAIQRATGVGGVEEMVQVKRTGLRAFGHPPSA
jgi:hypothetical protein